MGRSKAISHFLIKTAFCSAAALLTSQAFPAELTATPSEDQTKDVARLMTMLNTIRNDYVDEGTPAQWNALFSKAMDRVVKDHVDVSQVLNDLLHDLDPHSIYLRGKSAEDYIAQFSGRYAGIGVEAEFDGSAVFLVAFAGSPAERAGIQKGDRLIAIDGEVLDQTLPPAQFEERFRQKMPGEPGTSVNLILLRAGSRVPVTVKIERDHLIQKPVSFATIGNDIGYVKLANFSYAKADEAGETIVDQDHKPAEDGETLLRAAVTAIQNDLGDNLKEVILDLRGNSGGRVTQSVAIADDFLDRDDIIVSARFRHSVDDKKYNAHPGDILKGMPLVVLVDEETASAAEIVAGALQDRKRAKIMGSHQTFGKGSIQQLRYNRWDRTVMTITTGRYYTPKGHSIQATGIISDIEVIYPGKDSKPKFSEATLPHALPLPDSVPNDTKTQAICEPARPIDPSTLSTIFVTITGKPDYALLCATSFLRQDKRGNVTIRALPHMTIPTPGN